MKKIICGVVAMLLLGSTSFAQSTAGSKQSKQNPPKGAIQKSEAPATKEATPAKTKKDGTPDMRHAENKKTAAAPTQKLKKDGTPDMRYKENKKAAAAKPSAASKKG